MKRCVHYLVLCAGLLLCAGVATILSVQPLPWWAIQLVKESLLPKSPKMRAFLHPTFVGKPSRVTVYIIGHRPGEAVTILLPSEISLLDGEQARQIIPSAGAGGYAEVTWKVKGLKVGKYTIRAQVPSIGTVSEPAPMPRALIHGEEIYDDD